MSSYINCRKCGEDSLDVDTLVCSCGYDPDAEADTLRASLAAATARAEEAEERARKMHRRAQQAEAAMPQYREVAKMAAKGQSTGRLYPALVASGYLAQEAEIKRLKKERDEAREKAGWHERAGDIDQQNFLEQSKRITALEGLLRDCANYIDGPATDWAGELGPAVYAALLSPQPEPRPHCTNCNHPVALCDCGANRNSMLKPEPECSRCGGTGKSLHHHDCLGNPVMGPCACKEPSDD